MASEELSDNVLMFEENSCVICRESFENSKAIRVSEKDMISLISFSKERGNSELHNHLSECISKTPIGKVLVHKDCHRDFTNKRRVSSLTLEDD